MGASLACGLPPTPGLRCKASDRVVSLTPSGVILLALAVAASLWEAQLMLFNLCVSRRPQGNGYRVRYALKTADRTGQSILT